MFRTNSLTGKNYTLVGSYEEQNIRIGDVVLFMGDTRLYFVRNRCNLKSSFVTIVRIPLNIEQLNNLVSEDTYYGIRKPTNRLIFVSRPSTFLDLREYMKWLMKEMYDMCIGKLPVPRESKDISIIGDTEKEIKNYSSRPLFPGWKFSPNKYDSYLDYESFTNDIDTNPMINLLVVLETMSCEDIEKVLEEVLKEIQLRNLNR